MCAQRLGILPIPAGSTIDEYEITLGTNHVGHALLTKLILPTLLNASTKQDADGRIIVLSSEAHALAPSGGAQFRNFKTYCQYLVCEKFPLALMIDSLISFCMNRLGDLSRS
jgi:NAD(P)-dependent dehydrogenase (short-subunit alcohol dehydrogenase family)